MKIGLISRGRTHSTAILESLAARYNVANHREIYMLTHSKIHTDYALRRKKSLSLEKLKFESELINITESLFSKNNFICKLWPSMLIYPHRMTAISTFDEIKHNILFDVTRYLKINRYDKLYFLDRELHISACSWVYSKKTHIYNYPKAITTIPKKPIITITENDYDTVRFYVLEYCLQQQLRKFLENYNIPFEDISDNYQELIDNSIAKTQKINRDYKSLITNYDELQTFIADWYPICLENTKDWQFM